MTSQELCIWERGCQKSFKNVHVPLEMVPELKTIKIRNENKYMTSSRFRGFKVHFQDIVDIDIRTQRHKHYDTTSTRH